MSVATVKSPEFKVIEELGVTGIKILLYLEEKKRGYVRQILREASVGYTAFYRALYKLKKFGLVEEDLELGRIRVISLTEKGEKIAEKLKEADTLLQAKLPE